LTAECSRKRERNFSSISTFAREGRKYKTKRAKALTREKRIGVMKNENRTRDCPRVANTNE